MDIFGVLTMLGGLALFLYGMTVLGDGLAKLSGGKLERILEKLTSNPLKAVLLGAGVTAVIQSSSATTVMVVGFVNSGIMKLSQAIGIIMGANVGTTVTSWILSLSGISSSNILIKMLKPSSFSPILAIVGIAFLMFSKKDRKKDIGTILVGFAVLMFGMDTMSSAVKPLADVPEFTNILTMFSNPLLGVLAGAILTAVIQSSSASVGILQALCATGSVSFGTAIPIIMGQNVGTCVTALISAIGANKNAKRAALVHLYFNIIGMVIFLVIFYSLNAFIHFEFLADSTNAAGIAVVHSAFNIAATLVLLPFSKGLEKLAYLTIKDDTKLPETGDELDALDIRFLETPGFATEQAKELTVKMAEYSKEALYQAISLFNHYDEDKANEVLVLEDRIDNYEDQLGSYLVKLSSRKLSEKDSRTISTLLHCIGDFERISDHAVNIVEAAKEMQNKQLEFSQEAADELDIFTSAVKEIVDKSVTVFETEDTLLATEVEPLEEVIDDVSVELKQKHINRLREGSCTIEMGFVLSDITNNYERIADHCSNIAVCLIQIKENGFDTHEYLGMVKHDNQQFKEKYMEYKEKYSLE